MTLNTSENVDYQHPGLFRRCAAMIYDSVLLLGVVLISFMPAPILSEGFRLSSTGKWVSRIYFLFVLFLFFGWFWTHRGQTLGMRAWRIKVIAADGKGMTWGLALKRYLLALVSLGLVGIGYFMCIFHPQNMTLHDLYSGSRLIMLERQTKKPVNS